MREAERDTETDRGRGRERWKPTDGAGDRDTRTQRPEGAGRGGRGWGERAILREAAWTEPPGRRGLGGPAELAEAWAAAGEGKGPLQPASRPAGSVPSPGRAVPSPPPHDSALCTPGSHPLTRTQHHSRLHVSPCSTQPGAHNGWQDPGAPGLPGRRDQTGDSSMPGTLSPAAAGATATTPLEHLDLQQDGCFPGAAASEWILSPTPAVLSLLQTAARAPPLREPLLGVSFLWVHCWVQLTAPRWSQGDMQLPVHAGPQESTPTGTVDRAGLKRSREGQAERPPRTAGLTCPSQHHPAATLHADADGQLSAQPPWSVPGPPCRPFA